MASLVLSFAGAAVGGMLGPVGAIVGRIAGAIGGSLIDQVLLGGKPSIEGPRQNDLSVTTSTEGAPISRLYGRGRVTGQMIWATPLEEVVTKEKQKGSGKLGGGATTTNYTYFANFAIGLAEGPVAHIARIWADGKLLDLTNVVWRFHRGTETQDADPLIVAREGPANAPAYRGLAYVVFERLPLANFGNRIPQLSFELIRPVGKLETMVRAVTVIPGTTEFGYEPSAVTRNLGPGTSGAENRHVVHARSDVVAALDELQALCPRLERVAVVVAWLGDDLRAGNCKLMPGVEIADKAMNAGVNWSVAGYSRGEARLASQTNGRPSYGGTPSDASVTDLIRELKARGLKVTLYPFIMMDIPAGNTLPDPWSGAGSQPPFPWRGRITCDPAPGRPGSADGTATATAQVDAFFSGYRAMILHYARLVESAGGVDAFLIGSEMRSLTRVRGANDTYPAVDQLVVLASEVRAICGTKTKITYAADWTEYGAHAVDANASTLRFPLDALWASPAIDAVGIDYYAPLSDWRDTAGHQDLAVTESIYDVGYLRRNLRSGEAFDWYYGDDAARARQQRTPITDGAAGKPWVFRVKDIWNWWREPHYARTGGKEHAAPTAWMPQSKPIWFTECGCPAVNKGTKQPSTFPDPKSSEGIKPYFSNGTRDDLIARRHLEAVIGNFDPEFGANDSDNPIAPTYGARMFDPAALHLWTWDARPFPMFPAAVDVWSDGENWETGHWLNGRFGAAPLCELVAAILTDAGVTDFDASGLRGVVDGYLIDRPMSPRAAIDQLARAFAFDVIADGRTLVFRQRGVGLAVALSHDDLVEPEKGAGTTFSRAQETELPREIVLSFTDTANHYRRSSVRSSRLAVGSTRVSSAELAIAASDAVATQRAEVWLQDTWAGREQAEFALAPSRLSVTAGDLVSLTLGDRDQTFEVLEVRDGEARQIKARSIYPYALDAPLAATSWHAPPPALSVGPPHVVIADLPRLPSDGADVLQRAGVFARPWPGGVALWRSIDGTAFEQLAVAALPAVCGEAVDSLPPGPFGRWDRATTFRVRLYGGMLTSKTDSIVLGGANAAALQRPDGGWEVFQFANATLVGEQTYALSGLLRGQLGTEWSARDVLPARAPFLLLDEALVPLAQGAGDIGRASTLRFVAAALDHGDPSAREVKTTTGPTALQPYAPVHLRAKRDASGVKISWVRRTRIDGDNFDIIEVPLGEESERYEVDILAGDVVRRTLRVTSPQAIYAAADELIDFGVAQTQLSLRVFQMSAVVGRGIAAVKSVPIKT
ncbi:hypothetical protein GJW-30_1_03774 [Variibacter gotjawalensis]|uniref:Uncharacterized protein n=1 Tax=Variibacter gotjawalensis TaxID=1333996 RepID=A0A0S3PZ57_9BRAD|nr:glycoside hydrolase/phage tail family protein [Variibacter gotjawalensis]NIK47054.1 hypothetical protein [Variibacter gotjawalensis]RZS48959.1 putative tail protein [Variibacter gotjawalensis]BAT61217.1 hypothetical protein GJW-30_1_03774 [Variibacter gotjawalensis]